MAQHTTIALVDDLDGSKGSETIQFGIDGQHFEIDLNAKNAKALRKALADFTAAARPVRSSAAASDRSGASSRPKKTAAAKPSTARSSSEITSAIRTWAQENGFEVAARGRISADVRAQYEAANASGS
jgi:hypothetical protein